MPLHQLQSLGIAEHIVFAGIPAQPSIPSIPSIPLGHTGAVSFDDHGGAPTDGMDCQSKALRYSSEGMKNAVHSSDRLRPTLDELAHH